MLQPLHALSGTLCAILYLQQFSVIPDLLDIALGISDVMSFSKADVPPGLLESP